MHSELKETHLYLFKIRHLVQKLVEMNQNPNRQKQKNILML